MNHQRIDLGQPGAVFPRIMTLPVQIGPLFLITNLQSLDNLFKKMRVFLCAVREWNMDIHQESSLEKIRLHAAATLLLIFSKDVDWGCLFYDCKLGAIHKGYPIF